MRVVLLLFVTICSSCIGLNINFGASDVLEVFGYTSNDIEDIEEGETSEEDVGADPPPHDEVAK